MDNDAKVRPLYLAKILYEQTDEDHYLTTAQLLQCLEEYGIKAHRQTIKADIEILQNFGMDIKEVKSTQNRYNLVSRLFDVPELKLLIDAVESSKFITKKKSKELVEKLSHLAGEHSAAELKRNLCVEGRLKPGNEKIYMIVDTINEAINTGRKISFQYFQYNVRKEQKLKRGGEPFIFSPLHMVWNGDYYYMIGVFDRKQKIGSFRVDRIAQCPQILDEPAVAAPDGFDMNEYLNTTFRMYNSEHCEVELVCDNSVMDSIIDRFGEDVPTYANDMTSFRAVVNVAASHIFYSWVFGFGGLVTIKGPENIKQQYVEMVQKAMSCMDNSEKESNQNQVVTDI